MKQQAIPTLVAVLMLGGITEGAAQTDRTSGFIPDLETSWQVWQDDPKRLAFWEEHGWIYEPAIKQLQDRNAPWWPVDAQPWEDGILEPRELPEGVVPDAMKYQTWNVPGGTFHLVSLTRLETMLARSGAQH